MDDTAAIHNILLERDAVGFVARDWNLVKDDFDDDMFMGSSAENGPLRLIYPTLESYRDSWLRQARELEGCDPVTLKRQLLEAMSLRTVEILHGRALVTKVIKGQLDGPAGPIKLDWVTYYFLRCDQRVNRWKITGFVGYLAHDWKVSTS
ncbi:MAG: hypothetical protein B5766_07970 [Candidatus Lumbricidophila eiseniae]|uniref:SnoaL-like domain-containing protein n=1 Tax=Candidatus Lumbricidiphila eiseniae TaxID=1969409 RepID=A0A2A6FRK8_9MICO|nr:MAG: hypothetical protein B5766_07970 [Candidatus Lumbricidophila eiseniae]